MNKLIFLEDMAILSFNVGVEFGQIIALSVMLFLISKWRKTESFTRFSNTANVLLILTGAALFAFQIFSFMAARKPEQKAPVSVQVQSQGHSHGDGAAHKH